MTTLAMATLLRSWILTGRFLYWTDNGQFPKIEKSNLDGSNRTKIVTTGIAQPRDLSVDFVTGDVYWVDTVVDTIQVATCARDVISSFNECAASIMLVNGRRCIVSSQPVHSRLQRISYSGGNRQIVRGNLPNAFGLALFGDAIYWVDRNLRRLARIPKTLGSNGTASIEVVRGGLINLTDVAVFDASQQPPDGEFVVT